MMASYRIEVDVDDQYAPGMQPLADVIADELERRGATRLDYDVEVHGPPELRIVAVPR